MTTPVFKDADLQRQFDRDGYVVIPFFKTGRHKRAYRSIL